MSSTINILVADDHPIYRAGIAFGLKVLGYQDVSFASNGQEVLEIVKENKVDIVLMDINMPILNGIDTTKKIVENYHHVRVLALSFYTDRLSVLKMIRAGAYGYLTKNIGVEELGKAIEGVMTGKKYYSEDIIDYLLIEMENSEFLQDKFNSVDPITKREAEIIRHVALGFTSIEISKKLFITVKTVETHRTHIFDKLKIKHSTDLIYFALDNGLITGKN